MLHEVGGTLGGETSGHILCLDKTTTGDGLISALQVLAVMKSTGAGLAELCAPMPKYPQVLLNVRVARRFDPMTATARSRYGRAPSSADSTAGGASCCGRPAPNPSFASWSRATMPASSKRAPATSRPRSKRWPPSGGRGRRGPLPPAGRCSLEACSYRAARLIFAAFPAGPNARRWWLCVVRWSQVIGKCTDRGPPMRRCSPNLEQRLNPEWQVDVVVFPPYVYLADAVRMLDGRAHRGGRAGCVRRTRGRLHRAGRRRDAQGCGLPLRDRRAFGAAALVSRR